MNYARVEVPAFLFRNYLKRCACLQRETTFRSSVLTEEGKNSELKLRRLIKMLKQGSSRTVTIPAFT